MKNLALDFIRLHKLMFALGMYFSVSVYGAAHAQTTINIATGEFPPYLSERLADEGLAMEIVEKAFAASGVEVNFGFFPWKRTYLYAEEGSEWHGSILWVYTDERAKSFHFSDPVVVDTEVLFALKDQDIEWTTVEDLRGKIIGGTDQTVYPLFEDAEANGILKIERAGNYDILFKRLLYRGLDAVPQVEGVGKYYLENNLSEEERAKIGVLSTPIGERKYHLILSKNNPDNIQFLEKFNAGLRKIKENGDYERLVEDLKAGKYNKATD